MNWYHLQREEADTLVSAFHQHIWDPMPLQQKLSARSTRVTGNERHLNPVCTLLSFVESFLCSIERMLILHLTAP